MYSQFAKAIAHNRKCNTRPEIFSKEQARPCSLRPPNALTCRFRNMPRIHHDLIHPRGDQQIVAEQERSQRYTERYLGLALTAQKRVRTFQQYSSTSQPKKSRILHQFSNHDFLSHIISYKHIYTYVYTYIYTSIVEGLVLWVFDSCSGNGDQIKWKRSAHVTKIYVAWLCRTTPLLK